MCAYASSPVGFLNIVQILMGPTIFILITLAHHKGKFFILRLDALFLLCTSATFFLLSFLVLMCSVKDSNMPYRRTYRTTFAFGSFLYAVGCTGFMCQEVYFGTSAFGRAAAGLSIVNCFAYVASAVIAFQPALV